MSRYVPRRLRPRQPRTILVSRRPIDPELAVVIKRLWLTAHRHPDGLIVVDGTEFQVVVSR